MDTETLSEVDAKLALIKSGMPQTYDYIQRAAAKHGKQVYAIVRRALGGEANCFYAFEAGHVVGTMFTDPEDARYLAMGVIQFGSSSVVLMGGGCAVSVQATRRVAA